MKVAFIYPGQGSQKVGMGLDLYETQPEFRIAMDQMDPTGRIRELCFNGTARELADTRNTQPCMVACECALTATLYSLGVAPAMLCGLSLGEYSALAAAGVLEARQAVDLAAFRGVEMARAVAGRDCGMAAVLGLDRSSVEQACEEASSAGVVEPTNYNCPGQIVVSGDAAAVTRACELATQAGAKRCVPLPVSGPFHTSLMKPAGDALRKRLAGERFGEMRIPVVFNTTARFIGDGQTVAGLLEQQVQHSVYFEDSVTFMAEQGVQATIELGPGDTLSKFVRKTARGMTALHVEDAATLSAALDKLSNMDGDEAL